MTKKNLTFFITSICFLFWACSSFALVTQYQEAIDAYKRKDYKTAYQLILPLAKKGYSKAQYSLGMMYEKGKGVNKDSDRAKKWFQYAADQGLAKAQKKLNSNQEGNPKTLDQNSIKLNTKNLENGLNALNKKNYATAHKLFLELAEQGNVDAQYNLGLMYGKGKGVKKDYREAIKWWVLAANQGNGKAQTNLGWMYEIGIGVQKDAHKAAHWYQIASNQGIAKAQDKLNLLLNKTNKNSQENTASSSKDISNLNTGSVSSGKNTLDAAGYIPDAFNKIGEDTNDLDRLHTAINALDNKKFSTAHKLFLDLANKGIAEAQINLGMMFELGQGVPQNYDEAIRRYRIAANMGLVEAQEKLDSLLNKMAKAQVNLGLGMRFENGQGVPQDFDEAIRRYRIAANLGLVEAQEKLDALLNKTHERLKKKSVSTKEFQSSKKIKDIQTKTNSFTSEAHQIEIEEAKSIDSSNQPSTQIEQEQLENISDNLSGLNTGSVSFDGDSINVASYNSDKLVGADHSIDVRHVALESSQKNSSAAISDNQVPKYLDQWVRSWEMQDINLYLSFYSNTFQGLEETHADWRISRQAALKRNVNISIQLENIKVSPNKDSVEINFTQIFESDSYSDIGTKKLVWVKNGTEWRIIKEVWKPKKPYLNYENTNYKL